MVDQTTDTTGTETSTATSDAAAAAAAATSDADAATTGGSDASQTTDVGTDGSTDDATVLGSADAADGAGDKGSDDKTDADGKGDQQADAGLPEKYDLNVTVQVDGKDQKVELDPVLVDEATPVFKELGFGNEQANKIVALVPKVQERLEQQKQDEFAAIRADWAKKSQEDEEIGGKNWKQTQTLAARALDHFGAPKGSEFRQLLDDTGLGNHPEMIRMFRKIGEAAGEDGTFARGDGKIQKKSREEELYPDDVPKK